MNKVEIILEFDAVKNRVKENAKLSDTLSFIDNLKPYKTLKKAQEALDLTDEGVVGISKYGVPSFCFNVSLKEILALVKKGHILREDELKHFHGFYKTLMIFKEYVSFFKREELLLLKDNILKLFYDSKFNLKLLTLTENDGTVKENATLTLSKITKAIETKKREIKEILKRMVDSNSEYLVQKELVLKDDRLVLALKREHKNKIKGIVVSESQSGETVFIEPISVTNKNLELLKLEGEREREILKILVEITSTLEKEYDEFLKSYQELVFLDFLFSKALFHKETGGERPILNSNEEIKLKNSFHPLLNVETIVKNDLVLTKDTQGLIITGPNTGGKTIILKMLGLFAIMVKYGFLISSERGSLMPFFNNVFADIGDEQSIHQNLSTFSGHLKRIINITNNIKKNSLVLLDELGSGTDPKEGTSLAIAIFTYLIEKGAKTIITTHYSELKSLAYTVVSVKNASMEFDNKTLAPTFKIKLGFPGTSNAIVIAKRLGLNEQIVDLAERKINETNTDNNQLINELTENIQALDEQKETLTKEKEKLETLKKSLLHDYELLEQKRQKEYLGLMKNLEENYERELNELKESYQHLLTLKENIKEHELSKIKQVINKHREASSIPQDEELNINDQVFIESLGIYGVIKKCQNNSKYVVDSGNMSLTLPKNDLKKVKETSNKKVKQLQTTSNHIEIKGSLKIDLRGLRFEEAKDKLLTSLEDAYVTHLKEVIIVHGYGTGALRKLVWELLPKLSYIKNYRYGGVGEGLNGATIVTFDE